MKQVSSNYAALRNQTGSYYEVRLQRIVPGENNSWTYVTYGMDKLKSIEITNALYDESGPKIGGVCASQCTVKMLEQSANWPRMAKFEVQVRVCGVGGRFIPQGSTGLVTSDGDRFKTSSGIETSDWVSMGTFFTDTRKADKRGNLEITAYDEMLMLEQTWYDKISVASRPTYWPITATQMASLLVEATGMQIDSRSVLENSTRYIGLDNMSTAREMLSIIAAGLGGNWYITTEGKLRLISQTSDSEDTGAIAGIAIAGQAIVGTNGVGGTQSGGSETTNVGMSVMSLEISEELPAIDAVELTADSGVIAKYPSSNSGYTLRSYCNFADTNVASLCLRRASGYKYKPFIANGARLDPAAEVGDYVQIGNELFPIVTIHWRLGKHPVADISAPFDESIDHEYPMMSEDQKTLRKAKGYANDTEAKVYAELEEITASFEIDPDEIRAKVDKVHQGEQYTFEWVLNDTAHTWYANGAEVMHVGSNGLTVEGEVKANSGIIGVTNDAFSIVPRHTDTEQDPVSGEDIQVTYPSSIQNGVTKFSDDQHQGVYIGTDGIRLGPNFTVDKYGVITAKSGIIGGFTIGPNAIYSNGQSSFSGTGTGIHLSPNGIRLGAAFKVTPSGAVTASNINVTGGSITGGSINITRTEEDENTGQEITVPVFSVSSNGYLNANFTGGSLQIGDKLNLNGNALTLGGFTIGANAIYSTDDEFSVSISPNGINLGSTFHVDNEGNAYFGGTIYAQNIVGAVTEQQLAAAVQTMLGYATAYNRAIQVNTNSYPAQFTTTGLYADWLFAKQNPGQAGQYYSVKDHTHTFTEGTGANAGKIYIGPADLTGADHFFNIADTQTYINGVSAARQTALNSVTIDRTYDETTGEVNGAYTFNGHEYVDVALLSDNTRFTTQKLNVDDLTSGGTCPVMGINSMLYTQTSGIDAYSQVTVTFSDNTTGTYSLPLVYNSYASENETLYNYARYIGGRSPAITNRSVTPTIYDEDDPYVLPVEVSFNTNGNAQSFETTVNVYDVYESGRQAGGGGGICPIMEIDTVQEDSYSDTVDDLSVEFDNSWIRYDSGNDVFKGRVRVNMKDHNHQTVYIKMPGQRKTLTPPSYTVTNGNVSEDQNNPYSSSNPYVFNVVASFSVDGNSRSYTSWVNVYDVYQAGVTEGESHSSGNTYVGNWYNILGTGGWYLSNYSQVQTQLYYLEEGRYVPWSMDLVPLYMAANEVYRYEYGEQKYLYELVTS